MTMLPPFDAELGAPAPGYYPDPSIPGYVRYWDGARWVPGTSRPKPSPGEELPPPRTPASRATPRSPRATPPPPASPALSLDESGPLFLDETSAGFRTTGPSPAPPAPEPSPAAEEPRSGWAVDASQQRGLLETRSQPHWVSWGVPEPEPQPSSWTRATPSEDRNEENGPAAKPDALRWPDDERRAEDRSRQAGTGAPVAPAAEGTLALRGDDGNAPAWPPAPREIDPRRTDDELAEPGPAAPGPDAWAAEGWTRARGTGVRPSVSGRGPDARPDAPWTAEGWSPARSTTVPEDGRDSAPASWPLTDGSTTGESGRGSTPSAWPAAPSGNGRSATPDAPTLTDPYLGAAARSSADAPSSSSGLGLGPLPLGAASGEASPRGAGVARRDEDASRHESSRGVRIARQESPYLADDEDLDAAASRPEPAQGVRTAIRDGDSPRHESSRVGAEPERDGDPSTRRSSPRSGASSGRPQGAAARRSVAARPAPLGRRVAARVVDAALGAAVVAVVAVPEVGKVARHLRLKIDAARAAGTAERVWLVDATVLRGIGLVLVAGLVAGLVLEVLPTAAWGCTPGKRLFRLRVLDQRTREVPRVGRSLLRWLWHLLLAVFFPLGLLTAALDRPLRRTWHDRLARTFVTVRQR